MAGQLRVDEITDEAGTGSPSFPQGIQPNSLGTGTPGAGNFLRGDGAWEAVDIEGELEAFAGGEPGQPRLVGNAVSVFPGTYPVLTVTTSNAVSVNLGLGTVVSSATNNTTTFVDGVQHIINKYTGSINFRVVIQGSGGAGNAECRVLKNGSVVQTFTFSFVGFDTNVAGPVNISVVPTDIILWQLRFVTGTSTGYLQTNGNNTASNGYLVRELFAPAV